jgi:hypothetical protein
VLRLDLDRAVPCHAVPCHEVRGGSAGRDRCQLGALGRPVSRRTGGRCCASGDDAAGSADGGECVVSGLA